MKGFWKRIWHALRTNVSLNVIIVAALLLQLTIGVMYISARRMTQRTLEQLVDSEMNSIAMGIRKQLAKVEVAVDNMDWMLQCNLSEPDSMFSLARLLVENNPAILGAGISFKPCYYPQKGNWFEPYAVQRADGTVETLQLGSASHDYTRSKFYTFTMVHDSDHWSGPYLDRDGARTTVVSYSSPLHDTQGQVVAVVSADLSIQWLRELMEQSKRYKTTHRYLLSHNDSLLAGDDSPLFRTVLSQLQRDRDRKGYVTLTDSRGDKQHLFYNPVGGITGWTLVCVCSDRDIFATLRHTSLLLLLLVVSGMLIAIFIVYRSSRNLERLHKANAEKERIAAELRVASLIQQSMLPPDGLHDDHIDICGSLVPAREVGGDLFDFFTRDDKLFFCIGDVSGKGAPSAMLMAVVHALFRAFSDHDSNPARIVSAINAAACRNNGSNMFVTLFIGVLDLPTGHLRYCDAGHEPPLLLATDGIVNPLPALPHLPVGVFPNDTYSPQESFLQPDTALFLYTDGLTEAKNSRRQQFGLQRTTDVLHTCALQRLAPRPILDAVGNAVHSFVNGAPQSDDLTLLALRYTPTPFITTLDESIRLQNTLDQVPQLGLFVKSLSSRLHLDTSLARQIQLAVEETVVNVIQYAYPAHTAGSILIRFLADRQTLKIVISDSGSPFDPTSAPLADTSLPAEERPVGGLGIHLVRKLMDTVNYERTDGQNILTLTKKLQPLTPNPET